MTARKTEGYAQMVGRGFACDVDVDTWTDDDGSFKASASIGDEYYESDPYRSQDLALCEVKGWLEGVRAKIDSAVKGIERRLV